MTYIPTLASASRAGRAQSRGSPASGAPAVGTAQSPLVVHSQKTW
jgi:hypothetical protein